MPRRRSCAGIAATDAATARAVALAVPVSPPGYLFESNTPDRVGRRFLSDIPQPCPLLDLPRSALGLGGRANEPACAHFALCYSTQLRSARVLLISRLTVRASAGSHWNAHSVLHWPSFLWRPATLPQPCLERPSIRSKALVLVAPSQCLLFFEAHSRFPTVCSPSHSLCNGWSRSRLVHITA